MKITIECSVDEAIQFVTKTLPSEKEVQKNDYTVDIKAIIERCKGKLDREGIELVIASEVMDVLRELL